MMFKDPDAKKPYFINWSDWLGADLIVASTWSAPDGITLSNDSVENDTTAIVWVEGGTVGDTYKLVNHIVTQNGLEEDASLEIYIREN